MLGGSRPVGEIARGRLADCFTEHRDKAACVLIAEVQGNGLHMLALGQPLQRQNHMQLPAPASEAHAEFLHKESGHAALAHPDAKRPFSNRASVRWIGN